MNVELSTIHNNIGNYNGGGIINAGVLNVFSSTITSNKTEINNGGGVFQFTGTITILNTLVENNVAVNGGGGIAIKSGVAHIEDSAIVSNTASSGGGIFNQSDMTVLDTKIMSNTVSNLGGGIFNDTGGELVISDTVFGFNEGLSGGGVANRSYLRITKALFNENVAIESGGAIDNVGPVLIVSRTVFSENQADYGGAVYNYNYEAFIHESQFEDNVADWGGGLYSDYGFLHLHRSTIMNNIANRGGGVFNDGDLEIKNSTISSNQAIGENAEDGGGGFEQLWGTAIMMITQSTIANNTAPNQTGRDGIWQVDGTVNIQQSIVAGNGTENCAVDAGNWDGSAYNLSDDASCVDFMEADPMLAPLGDYGGNTLTHALLLGSPAVDAGENALCSLFDQRGEPRPKDGNGDGTAVCDIGSVEMNFWPWQNYLPIILR